MLTAIAWGICAAIIGVVYAHIMPDEPTPAVWWFKFLAWLEKRTVTIRGRRFDYGVLLAYPLGYCPMCCSGQIALWSYLLHHGLYWANVPGALLCTAVAILSVHPLITLHEWAKKLSKP